MLDEEIEFCLQIQKHQMPLQICYVHRIFKVELIIKLQMCHQTVSKASQRLLPTDHV